MSNTTDQNTASSGTSASTWIKRGVIAAVVLVAVVYGAIFFYAKVLNDSPDALDADDLSDALATTVVDTVVDPVVNTEGTRTADTAAPDTAAPDTAAPDTAAPDAAAEAEPEAGFDGVWTPTTASEFGYRVDEILGGINVTAVGRSNEIEGSLTIDGTAASIDATVEVANIVSDESRRDGAFRGRVMDVANFPTANFRTTEPIDFGNIPADGEQVTATAAGELTLKGVTLPVSVDVTAQASADSIGVLGNIPITFTDYGIDNPTNPGVSLEDEGIIEFVLVFERS